MSEKTDFDIVVIGAGIVGLASAYKITLSHPDVRIVVLEKEDSLASHQTGHNSGVIHSGLYYTPGSNKAKTCAEGRKQLVAFAKKHKIPYEICGKVIVATDESELPNLDKVFDNGQQNQIEGIEKIGPDEIKEIEPCCSAIAGIRVPCTGIIDFVRVAEKLAELIEKKGEANKILTSHEVTAFDKHDFYTKVVTNEGALATRYIINCAGLHSDRIAKMDGVDPGMRIIPFRGDYYELTEEASQKVKNLIYPVPDPAFPFLGVHFTRMIDGSVECGPNAVFSFKREGYGKTDFDLTDTWDSLSYWGTWRLCLRHWLYGLGEYTRAFSKTLFLRQLQRLVPSLTADEIKPGKAGVRAQALASNGSLIDDFKIESRGNSVHVLNAPSPAATAALAIGDHINEVATKYFKL
ncbi:MAG: L-2-hydroxyglutarate oxidase [Phycisphaerales bacterium]|nr:MAG: L-2-hydroxyglutarate oxidase [Phycisphaerales bacterium]